MPDRSNQYDPEDPVRSSTPPINGRKSSNTSGMSYLSHSSEKLSYYYNFRKFIQVKFKF